LKRDTKTAPASKARRIDPPTEMYRLIYSNIIDV
jgi:hypothetical protein